MSAYKPCNLHRGSFIWNRMKMEIVCAQLEKWPYTTPDRAKAGGRRGKKNIYKKLKEIRMDDLVLFDCCGALGSWQAVTAMKINWKKRAKYLFWIFDCVFAVRACERADNNFESKIADDDRMLNFTMKSHSVQTKERNASGWEFCRDFLNK